jgi:glycine dehydrogenase
VGLAVQRQGLPDFAAGRRHSSDDPAALVRQSPILSHPVFNRYHSKPS